MEKNKGLFSFREHPVGNFSERKKGRKRQGGRLRRSIGFLLAVALVFNTLSANGLTVSASGREAGLCKHHQEHDADCGYIPKSEDGEGSPCTYECRICPVENLIAALPDKGTKRNEFRLDNAEDVRAQLEEILALYRELNEDEQEQIDLSRCYELQAALDGANAPDPVTESVEYQEASWNDGVTYTTETADSCTPVADSAEAVTWNAGWYVVSGTVTISEPITVTGAVNLILADGCTLNAEKGIVVTTGNSLTIYAQSGGSGTLNATGTADDSRNASAGIGGTGTTPNSGAITIHGGVINAIGGVSSVGDGAAGIGGGTVRNGNGGSSGTVTIYGGTVTANSGTGNISGAGIGGGGSQQGTGGTGDNITIYGGSVTAASTGTQSGGAGIGGGGGFTGGGAGSNIQIYGGTINATGSEGGAGIGGGSSGVIENSSYKSGDGAVTISGGIVTAVGGTNAAGIGGGGGYYSSYTLGDTTFGSGCTGGTGSVTITGGIVDATGGAGNSSGDYAGAPIGNGGNTTATATVNKTTGIVFENGVGTVYGTVTIDKDYTVPDGYTLTIPNGATLSGTGTLSGGGTFIIENLTEDMISVPDIHYTSEDMAEEIKGKATISGKTICGQAFTVDTDDWTLSVTKVSDMEYTATYTNAENVTVSKTVKILPCLHDNGAALTRHEGKAADCTQTGVKEYWDCSVCGKKFSDQDGQTEITDTEIPIAAHTLTHHEKVDADCTQTGNLEYWECSVCKKIFSDKDGQTEITEITIPVTDHTLIHHEGQEATCTAAGNKEYWDCSVCGKKFSDQDGKTEIADADIVIAAKPHTLTHHAEVEAGCLTDGNIEYWSCDVCNKLFSDSDGKQEITDIKVSAKGHDYGAWGSNGNGTHTHSCQRGGCDSTETEDCSGGTATYTEEAICTVCGGKYGELLKDAGAPTGEISIGTNKWNSFLNTITFGQFFKKTEQVTITAQDNESGVASVSYYISDSGLTEEEVKKLDNWTAGNTDKTTITISQKESCVVYAKITDNQGNMIYISSDGLQFDGTLPSITGVTDGETYCTPQTVTVTDDNLETVTVNGKEQILSDGKFTLDVKFDTAAIVIAAEDKAGNVTKVTVNAGHSYGTEWKSDSDGHWQECAVCGDKSKVSAHTEDSGTVTKPATQTETGIRIYKCSVCGYEMRTEIIEKLSPSHKHSYGTEWKSDSNGHWHECGCGAKSDSGTHTEDGGTATKPATQTETGIRTYKCSVCGYKMRTEIIEKLPESHTHSYGTEWKSDSNNHWHECGCGAKSDSGTHTEDSGTVTKPATETETGIRTYKCSVCGYEMRTEIIEKLPESHKHSYGTEWKSDSNNHWHECGCGDKSDSAAHTEDSGTVIKPATETETGIRTYKCSVCGYEMRTEEIGKLPSAPTETPTPTEPTETLTPTEPAKQPQETVTPGEVRRNSSKLDSGINMKWKGKKLVLKWTKIAGAGGYDIFAGQSGKKLSKKSLVKTVKNGKRSVSLTKIAGKKLSGKKMYSVQIKAWKYTDGKKIYIGNSRTYHIAGSENRKYTNAKKLKLKKKKYVLKKGTSARIKVTVIRQSKKKKLPPKSYGPALQYWSDNEKIATVTQGGRVKAKKKGTCYIYVTALNGVRTKIKITVK
jgi:Zn ribbon nucleic-acid-binding protein